MASTSATTAVKQEEIGEDGSLQVTPLSSQAILEVQTAPASLVKEGEFQKRTPSLSGKLKQALWHCSDRCRPHTNPAGMVFEFTPAGETVCWDASSLLLMMNARRNAKKEDVYRHPIHNCKVDRESVTLVQLVAARSSKSLREDLVAMLNAILSGAVVPLLGISVGAFTLFVDRQSMLRALSDLMGSSMTRQGLVTLHDSLATSAMGSAVLHAALHWGWNDYVRAYQFRKGEAALATKEIARMLEATAFQSK
ncbi:hypothetical protein KFL_011270020 [Klebsormidium nitens]|uniref:Uncharacterized protein n=1 Tax=Klebsormidium nitens TaxID=105231 RepID=A0A1Y1IPF0_KLENI|nr:hypothetical protein KFL_011270020 [Klebsormidium nitens]|eukprot:GAQ92765.1 hypothetical protein KFL_011270020 [Klebsormidium nitens]